MPSNRRFDYYCCSSSGVVGDVGRAGGVVWLLTGSEMLARLLVELRWCKLDSV